MNKEANKCMCVKMCVRAFAYVCEFAHESESRKERRKKVSEKDCGIESDQD